MSPRVGGRAGRAATSAVDLPAAVGLVGQLLKYLSLAALFPTVLAIGYREPFWPFLAAGAIAATVGYGLERLGRRSTRGIGFREGYFVVAVTWLFAAAFGALPLILSGEPQFDRPIDAYFEAMSGFTTTGASVVTDFDALDRSLLMWRQFTQFLGGMGIIVLALAVLPRLRVGGRQLLENELPGPEIDQLGERIRSTAQRLWLLYIGLTATLAVSLTVIGWSGLDKRMTTFDAWALSFTTLPTGGFGTDGRSIEPFAPITQWFLIVFMVIAGANFALTYRAIVRRDPAALRRDEELRLYLGIIAVASVIVATQIWTEGLARGEDAIRDGIFQTVSIVTTTGYATHDFAVWPTLALMTLVMLMFIGGSAGSTGGSIKVVRHLMLGKMLRRELRQTVHPELVSPVRLNRVVVDERTLRAVMSFILLYVGIFVLGAAVLAVDTAIQGPELRVVDTIAAAATTLGNVGPGFYIAGPMGSFEPFSDVSTVTMILLMWVGRLEVIPIVVLLTRGYWRV